MSYILEFRDEQERTELMTKLNKAKKALCEVCDMMEEIEGGENTMNERGMYRDEMYERGMHYRRGGRYRY
jgi:hypothetical protein